MSSRPKPRWIVRNAILTPECGNGVWSYHRTWIGARHTLVQILSFKWRTGFYTIPAGGLIVTRAKNAGPRWTFRETS